MSEQRLYTDEQLEELCTQTVDLLIGAIQSGDKEKAIAFAKQLHEEGLFVHDGLLRWLTGLLSHIYRNYGDEALEKAHRDTSEVWLGPLMQAWADLDVKGKVEVLAKILRVHFMPVKIQEDDDKFVAWSQPCTGGSLLQQGVYDPPLSLAKIREPHDWTFGRSDLPIYCTHCAFMNIMPIEWTGEPFIISVPGEKLGTDICKRILYKDPDNIPEEVYQTVGKEKKMKRKA